MSKKWPKLENILRDGIKAGKHVIDNAKNKATITSKKVSLYMAKNQLKEHINQLGAVVYRNLTEEDKKVDLNNKTIETLCKNITEKKHQVSIIENEIKKLKDDTNDC